MTTSAADTPDASTMPGNSNDSKNQNDSNDSNDSNDLVPVEAVTSSAAAPGDEPSLRPWWRGDWVIALGLLLVLSLVGYGQLLRPGMVPYSKFSDNIAYNLASKQVLYQSIKDGHGVPLWQSYQHAGYPALTQPQALYGYPFYFLFWVLPAEVAVGWTLWLHMILAGLALFLLGGVFRLSLGSRLLMATAGLFSFKLIMAIYTGWLPLLPGYVIVPLLVAVVFDAVQRPRWQSGMWMALVGGLCLQTGHLQFFYYVVLLLALYVIGWGLGRWRAGAGRETLLVWGWLGAGALLATASILYLFVPLGLEAPLTTRTAMSYNDFLAGHATSIKPWLTLFWPEVLGTPLDGSYRPIELWEDMAYFGIIPLLLALVGMIGGWRRRFVPVLSACFVLCLCLTFDSPLLRFCFDWLPGFKLFRLPGRFFFVSAMWGLLLAGIGWDVLLKRWQGQSRMALWLTCGVLLCISAEGTWHARRYVVMKPQATVMPITTYARWFAKQKRPFRVAPLGRPTINSGWAARLQLSLISGYEPYNYRHYQAYISLLQSGRVVSRGGVVWTDLRRVARPDLLNALNVRYVVSPSPLPAAATKTQLRRVASWPKQPMFLLYQGIRKLPFYVYENRNVLPRVYWAREVIEAHSTAAMTGWMAGHLLGRKAVVRWPGRSGEGATKVVHRSPRSSMTTPQLVIHRDGLLMAMVRTKRRRFLVVSEVWHPGWRAFVDGKEVPLAQTNLALMGLWVSPGTHQVKLSFRPMGWPFAGWCSLGALLLCLLWAALVWWKRRSPLASDG